MADTAAITTVDLQKLRHDMQTIMEELDRTSNIPDAYGPQMWKRLAVTADRVATAINAVRMRLAGKTSSEIAGELGLTRQQVAAYVAWNTMMQPGWAKRNAERKAEDARLRRMADKPTGRFGAYNYAGYPSSYCVYPNHDDDPLYDGSSLGGVADDDWEAVEAWAENYNRMTPEELMAELGCTGEEAEWQPRKKAVLPKSQRSLADPEYAKRRHEAAVKAHQTRRAKQLVT